MNFAFFDAILHQVALQANHIRGNSDGALAAAPFRPVRTRAQPPSIAEQSPDLGDAAAERLERVHDAMTAPQGGPDTAELLAKRDALLALAEDRAA